MNNPPADKNRRILIIDDNRAIHDDFRKILSPATVAATALDAAEAELFGKPVAQNGMARQVRYEIDSAYQGQEGVMLVKQALEAGRPYAMAYVDVRMPPGMDGVETARKIWELDPDLQVVLCTAYSDYSWGEMFEKLGQHDGLLILKKPFDTVEALQLAHALTEKWWLHRQSRQKMEDLEGRVAERTAELAKTNEALQAENTERKRTEERLRVQTTALDAAANAIVITDHTGAIQSVNRAFTALTGYTAQEVVGQNPRILKSGKQDEASYRNLWQTISSGRVWSGELTNRRKDGSLYAEEMTITPLRNAEGTIVRYIAIKQDITARQRAAEELRKSEERFRRYFELGLIGMAISSPAKCWIEANDQLCRMFGYDRGELLQMSWEKLTHPDDLAADLANFNRVIAGEVDGYSMNKRFIRKDGRIIDTTISAKCLRRADGSVDYFVVLVQDITERKRLEAQLFQSQKMETVGKLAGGIAHEFNSILTAIIGQSELLLEDLSPKSPLRQNATEIIQAAERAATLTRQMLAYGRKQFLRPEALDLNRVITNMEGMFHHLLGGDVETQIVPASGLHLVRADAGQIEQVIMNMVINARDAMPNGGKLVLETADVSFDQDSVVRYPELKPGDYVRLAITDTGAGMSEGVKARVFEPFFTTKGVGEGTGLGLSTCYGIVKQSGGHISVYSEPGRGTTFKIYLPQVELAAKISIERLDSPDLPRGAETILLVEDDPALREMAATLLRRLGYTVLAANHGIEALSLCHQRDTGHIDLLFTDVVMPHMSGKELADRVRVLYPRTRILFTSAYTENAIVHQGVLDKGVLLLQKPFTPSALAHKVREVLDKPGASKPACTAPEPATDMAGEATAPRRPGTALKTSGPAKIHDKVKAHGN